MQGLEGIAPLRPGRLIHVRFARAIVHMQLAVEPAAPHLISGLLLTGADLQGDTMAAMLAELRQLPGQVNFAAHGLARRAGADSPGSTGPASGDRLHLQIVHPRRIEPAGAGGPAALERRRAVDRSSIGGGTIAASRGGAGHRSHAGLADISISDNSATDILLHVAGRENVERTMATMGVHDPARNRPLLSTLELGLLKAAPATALALWQQADEATRRQLLANDYAATVASRIDFAAVRRNPVRIDTVEWFASASDFVRVMDWLRLHADPTAKAILAISGGLAQQAPTPCIMPASRAARSLAWPTSPIWSDPGAAPGMRSSQAGTIRRRRSTPTGWRACGARDAVAALINAIFACAPTRVARSVFWERGMNARTFGKKGTAGGETGPRLAPRRLPGAGTRPRGRREPRRGDRRLPRPGKDDDRRPDRVRRPASDRA